MIYILEKLLGNILVLRKNAGKTFTESYNNPAQMSSEYAKAFFDMSIV